MKLWEHMHGADIITCVSVDQSDRCASPDSVTVTPFALSRAQNAITGALFLRCTGVELFFSCLSSATLPKYILQPLMIWQWELYVFVYLSFTWYFPLCFPQAPPLVPLGMRHYYKPNKEMGWLKDECNVPMFINAHFTHWIFIYLDMLKIYFLTAFFEYNTDFM